MDYKQQLLDPRWQKKRLEILQRDNFSCQICGDTKSTLHVHHLYYDKTLRCWEYPNTAYITLCEKCHKQEYECETLIKDSIQRLRENGITLGEIWTILYCLEHDIVYKHNNDSIALKSVSVTEQQMNKLFNNWRDKAEPTSVNLAFRRKNLKEQ